MDTQGKIDFKEFDDEKLLLFIGLWESCPVTHIINDLEVYQKALKEKEDRGL